MEYLTSHENAFSRGSQKIELHKPSPRDKNTRGSGAHTVRPTQTPRSITSLADSHPTKPFFELSLGTQAMRVRPLNYPRVSHCPMLICCAKGIAPSAANDLYSVTCRIWSGHVVAVGIDPRNDAAQGVTTRRKGILKCCTHVCDRKSRLELMLDTCSVEAFVSVDQKSVQTSCDVLRSTVVLNDHVCT